MKTITLPRALDPQFQYCSGQRAFADKKLFQKNDSLYSNTLCFNQNCFKKHSVSEQARFHNLKLKLQRRRSHVTVRCSETATSYPPLSPLLKEEPSVINRIVKAFAPATIANFGPGFDFLGCAVEGLGDYVTAEVSDDIEPGKIVISEIKGDEGRLSLVAEDNCVGIAAKATLELLNVSSVGIRLSLDKGLPLGSGLGSSAASAAAACMAVNALFGNPLSKDQLVEAGLRSEAYVSGYHADNIAPAILGGFVLIRSYEPLELISLPYPKDIPLFFVLATPAFEAPTKKMRQVLPKEISMKCHVANSSQASALTYAILSGNAKLLGSALGSDTLVEPRRGQLIPGFSAVKINSKICGGFGCTISGAGPTVVSVTDDAEKGEEIGKAMVKAFLEQGKLNAKYFVKSLNREGAKIVN